MAKANWANVSPSSGSGNATVNVSSTAPNTGRNKRSTTLTITAANVTPVTVAVNQAGKPQYAEMQDTATAPKAAANVTISGKSNAKKLTFSIGTQGNTLKPTLPAKYTAAGVETTNGESISGDPGANAEYDFSIVIPVLLNETIEEKTAQIIVTDDAGNTDTCVLTQAAGDATLSVSKTSIDLTYQGTAVSFDVKSNTTWSIA